MKISNTRACHECLEIIHCQVASILKHDSVGMFICDKEILCDKCIQSFDDSSLSTLKPISSFHRFLSKSIVNFYWQIITLICTRCQWLHSCKIWLWLEKQQLLEADSSPTDRLTKWASVPSPQIFMNLDRWQGLTLCHWRDCFCMYLVIPKPWQLSPWIPSFNSIIL